MTPPLRIGILGAARIADDGIIDPARALGHRIVAVAARDRGRAEAFAAERGVEKVHDSYQEVVDDPDVEIVYNCLVNSLHTEWNIAALRAGKHVLSEKPIASNAAQAREVREVAAAAGKLVVEGFHYLHHPVNLRLRDLVASGELGSIERVDIELTIPAPPATDPRWSLELDGGATMDLGCYVLSAARRLGSWIGREPELRAVEVRLWEPKMDSSVSVELIYPDNLNGSVMWDMDAAGRRMIWTVQGSEATASSPAFAVPHIEPCLIITDASGQSRKESLGTETSYTYQLAAFAETLNTGELFLVDIDDSVANAELVDTVYRRAGLEPRG